MRRDERGLIGLAMLANLALLAIFALVLFDIGTVMFARLKAQDVAETAATEGARAFKQRGSTTDAEAAVRAEIDERDATIELIVFQVQAGGSVKVEVRKRPGTLLFHQMGFLQGFVRAAGSATRAPPRGL